MRKLLTFILAVVLVATTAPAAWAQGIDGTLRGEVKDPSGALVPGAKVTVTDEKTGLSRAQDSSSVGTFNFPNLLISAYTLTVEGKGFKKYVRKGIAIKANQVTELAVTLEVGAAVTVVEVVAGGELVQTSNAQLGGSWDSRSLTEVPLPVLSGDPQNLAILMPGTTTQSGGVVGVGGAIGGNRPRNNNFVVDGIDNNDVTITGPVQPIIPDAIAEFTLLTNQFSAEYGHSTAGQFIQTTKSGGNEWHGNAFWFVNNRNFNALDNLDAAAIVAGDLTEKPRFDRNRLGGTVGGPILKNKLFIFGAYQYTTLGQAATPGGATDVPTAAGFTTLTNLASTANSGVRQLMVDILRNNLSPAAVQSGTVTVLDDSRVNPATGLPGVPVSVEVGTLTPSAPNFFNQHDFHINGDWNTARHRVSTRYSYDRFRAPDVPAFPLPQFVGNVQFDARSATITDIFTFRPNLINEFRGGYRRGAFALALPGGLQKPATLDIFPNFVVDELGLNIGPSGESPQSGIINTYQVADTVTWLRGKHTFKGGADVRWWIAPTVFLPRARGEYDWNSLNSFVKDLVPDGGNEALRGVGDGSFAGNQWAIYGFFQDDWKIHPRLTLNLGLRYEFSSNPRDAQKQELNKVANLPNPSNTALQPLLFNTPKSDKNNWAPRIGFAWDVFGDHKTSVRGGFALAYDVIFQNLTLLQLPPQLQQELNRAQVCAAGFPNRPAWCPTGTGFVANGALPGTFVPQTLSQADARSGTQSLIVDTVSPTTYTWSLSVQREVYRDWSVEVRYLGTRALKLPVQVRRNVTVTPAASLFLPTFLSPSQVPTTFAATAPTLAAFRAARDLTYAADGFDGGFITVFDPVGNSIYHGGSIEVNRRFAGLGSWGNGLLLKSSYTFSRTIDDSTNELFTSFVNPRRPQNHANLRDERGLSGLDHRHKYALAIIYETPKYKGANGFLKHLIDLWEISASYIAESGQPVTPLSFVDANGNFDSAGDRAIFNPNFSAPNTSSNVNFVCRAASGASFTAASAGGCGGNSFVVGYVAQNPAARFIRAQVGARTNTGRNILIAPGINNWNIAVFKKTNITESKHIEFRVEMLNAFNHPQFILGSGNINNFTFNAREQGFDLVFVGDNDKFMQPQRIFSGGGRFIQFGLKVVF